MEMSPEELDEARRRAKILRRSGFAFAFVAMVYISGPMIYGAFAGVMSGEVYDPYTNERVQESAQSTDPCLADAEELIGRAASLERLDPVWDDQTTDWMRRCRKDHDEAYMMLNDTRRKLRTRGKEKG